MQNDIDVWLDSSTTNEPAEVQLKRWLEGSKLFVALITPKYFSSKWCRVEWDMAKQVVTPKLAILLDGVALEDCPAGTTVLRASDRSSVPQLIVDHVLRADRKRIFISYSRRDKKTAAQVTRFLSMSLNEHWIDGTNLVHGKAFESQIMQAIHTCNVFLLIWSRHALHSEWVAKEWNQALSKGRVIMPILIDKVPLPTQLAGIQSFTTVQDPRFFQTFNILYQKPTLATRIKQLFGVR